MTKRMSTAVAQDLASRRRRQQSAATILLRRYDELIDAPMNYWHDAGPRWREKVLEARVELHRIIGMEADEPRRQETEEFGWTPEQRWSEAGDAGEPVRQQIGPEDSEDSSSA